MLQIAELMFGGRQYLTTINMSEYQEKHTVSRLIGSPPGYVGFGEGRADRSHSPETLLGGAAG